MKEENHNKSNKHDLIYQLEGRPPFMVAFPLGLQHILAMFAGNLAPILIIIGVLNGVDPSLGFAISAENSIKMVQVAMLASGLTTLLQLYPFRRGNFQVGANLPIVMGTAFAFVPTAITIAGNYGLPTVLGSCLVGSFVTIAMGFLYKYLKKYFTELVIGSVLIAIGIHLLDVGVQYCAGGAAAKKLGGYGSISNLALAFTTFAVIIFLQKFGKGMFKISAILIGLVVGYILGIITGKVNLSIIANADWFGLPMPAMFITEYKFELAPIISAAIIYVVIGLETIGNVNGITIAAFDRPAKEKETSGAILADGVGCMVASLLNALPNTAFGQNAGIIAMTKIVNKWCITLGAFLIIGAAFIPKLGAIFRAIPDCVLGGAVITVFAMIVINGIKMISQAGFSNRNVMVLGITFGLGYGFGVHPEITQGLPSYINWIFKDTVACVCMIAMLASIIFPEEKSNIAK